MNDERIDNLLAGSSPAIQPELAAKIRAQMRQQAAPVKPLPAPWFYTLVFCGVFAAIGVAFASRFGFAGWHAQSARQAALFLTSLCGLAIAGGAMVARALRPGSGSLYAGLLSVVSFAAYEALVLTLYRNYSITGFVHLGLICVLLGVLCGVIAAVPIWLVVRRGFAVHPRLSGAVIGLVGGLTGLLALTLLCPLLTTPHAAVWHAAVVPICVLCGVLASPLLVRRA